MTDLELLADCRDKIYPALVREHAKLPLYVLPMVDVAGLPPLDCLGWCMSNEVMDRHVIDKLGAEYTTPGTVIALDMCAIREAGPPEHFVRRVFNVFIHELGHAAPFLPIFELPDTKRIRDLQFAAMEREATSAPPEPFMPSNTHNWQYVRRTVHLAYRALLGDIDFSTGHLFGRGFSPFEGYLVTLLPECVRMHDATFLEIESTDPPAEFMQQYDADRNWYNEHRNFLEN